MATIISAPALMTKSRMVIEKSVGTPYAFASSENEYWVLAIHTGNLSKPSSLIRAKSRLAAGRNITLSAP